MAFVIEIMETWGWGWGVGEGGGGGGGSRGGSRKNKPPLPDNLGAE